MRRGRYVLTGILRLLTLRPCREPFCSERIRCWRWHVEVFTCPTCGHAVTEFESAYGQVIAASWTPEFTLGPTATTSNGVTHNYTYQFRP